MMRPSKPEIDSVTVRKLFSVRFIWIWLLQTFVIYALIPSRSDALIVRL